VISVIFFIRTQLLIFFNPDLVSQLKHHRDRHLAFKDTRNICFD